jgi:hypothetical protein
MAVLGAALVYQPWINTPFEIVDFSEFLPFLRGSDTFAQRFSGFARYYASQGRLNLLSYVFLIWKWSLMGWNEAGWQTARFIEMLCVVAGIYWLLRRLGATRYGSGAGAALFIVAHTASPAWIRLTMGEPSGVLLLIGAALMATRYQGTSRWRASGVAIASLLTASLLVKETLVALTPFVLLLACSWSIRGHFERPCLTRRNSWLLSLVAVGTFAILLPVAIVALRAGSGAYVSDYAVSSISLDKFIDSFIVILLPMPAERVTRDSLAQFSANLIFFAIVAVGLGVAQIDQGLRRRWQPIATWAILLVLVGALGYLPWPHFQSFYGLPFLVSPAILLAIAITSIEKGRPAWRWLAYAGCAVVVIQGALHAAHDARASIATRTVNGALIEDFAKHASADSIVVVMALRPPPAQAWQGRGPTLARYARAVQPGLRLPNVHEAFCSAASPMRHDGLGNVILVSYSSSCGTLPAPSRTLRYDYTYLEWPMLTPRRDSIVISIVGPEPGG